jgi:hypothetical protein
MAITPTFEWWSGEDAYAAADVLQDWESGSITSLVAGLRGEGNAINLPSALLRTAAKEGTVGQPTFIFHARIRYDADAAPFLTVWNSTLNGPFLEMSSGTITLKRFGGTTLASAATGWTIGEKHVLSGYITASTTATASAKIWLDATPIITATSIQTVPVAGNTAFRGMFINGLGVWDDIGMRWGSGTVADADVPLQKWVRLRMASALGTFSQFTTFGSGTTHLDRVNENPPDSTNGVEHEGADGSVEDFLTGSLPSNVGTVWGVQYNAQMYRDGGVGGASQRLELRDNSGNIAATQTGTNVLGLTPVIYSRFFKTNPRTSATWGAEFSTMQAQLAVTA